MGFGLACLCLSLQLDCELLEIKNCLSHIFFLVKMFVSPCINNTCLALETIKIPEENENPDNSYLSYRDSHY